MEEGGGGRCTSSIEGETAGRKAIDQSVHLDHDEKFKRRLIEIKEWD